MTSRMRQLRRLWDDMTGQEKLAMYNSLSKKEQTLIATSWDFMARPQQLSPDDWGGDKTFWIIVAGRGFGKTRTGSETTLDHVLELGKDARIALIAPTAADARDVMIEGESGILACAKRRGIKCNYEPSKRRISFDNGAVATAFTAEKPDRLRGPQHTFAWCDELSSWEYDQETWDMMQFGLRLGPCPKVMVTTTPKPRILMRDLYKDSRSIITRGSTYDNKDNLAPTFLDAIKQKYEGTRLGRQELYGELLEDNPDALWQPEMIERTRIREKTQLDIDEKIYKYNLVRIVVAVDPAVTSGEKADETGIVVVGQDAEGRFYMLCDRTGRYTPDEWGRVVGDLYNQWSADRVVAEVNQGGDMVEHVLRTVDRNISYRGVRASKGKRARAEPISALYEQDRVVHLGSFPELEEQMCMFTPDNFDGSPDRVDALVWGLTELSQSGRSGISFI
jgi:predicted phage terminase large subunit-like protein